MPHSERPPFPGPLLIRTQCSDTSSKETLWVKPQHEGALTSLCNARKKPQVPHTARQVACHRVINSRGKRNSIPSHKTRPDSPVPSLQEACDRSQKGREILRFLPHLMMRPSSIATHQVESREALPNSAVSLTSQRHPEKLPEVTDTSRGNPGFPSATRERPRESFFNPS